MKHSFGNINKYQEGQILEKMVNEILLKISSARVLVGPHVSNSAIICRANLMATKIDDPGRLPTLSRLQNLYYYRYVKALTGLVRTWWDYCNGKSTGLNVIVRVNVLEWMFDHHIYLSDNTLEIPCSSATY
jgi:hypothetical protein